jgi:hypothetical protein
MEALTKRLSHLDPDVEGVIRIVAFYDTLMRRRVDLSTLARVSAGLAECAAGIRLHGTGQEVRFLPDGKPAAGSLGSATTTAPITLDDEEVGAVWLERTGPPGPLDEACWTASPSPQRPLWSDTGQQVAPWRILRWLNW